MAIQANCRIGIVIASTGRPLELERWIDHVRRQTYQPSKVAFAIVKPSDFPDLGAVCEPFVAVMSELGSCRQRNVGMEAVLESSDIIAFFDDDYVPSRYCLEGIVKFFERHHDVVAANGVLLADGIKSPGIPFEDAKRMIQEHDNIAQPDAVVLHELEGLYGCNMVFRASAIGGERFDEELPLYAWQEDIDFAARVGKRGRLVKMNGFFGVHQGVKGARPSGIRLGYSQIANPVYMVTKGTLSLSSAARLIFGNIIMNHIKAFFPEPWIDRRGRCKGNWMAMLDAILGRGHPKKILNLPK
jgi:GT2 family glycosyltransferase